MSYDPTEQPMKIPGRDGSLYEWPPYGIELPAYTDTVAKFWSMTPAQLREVVELPIVDDLDHYLHHAARRELIFRALGSRQAREYLK